jgi:polysaccharide biosynthesis/export protein
MKGINRSITGLSLSVLVGVSYSLPTTAQAPPVQTTPYQSSAPQSMDGVQPETAYTLGAGDLLRIDSYDTPDLVLDARYPVLLDGSVNLPWVGSIPVAGLTLKEASNRLKGRYGKFIKNPTITVSLIGARTLKIGVIGEVTRPGSYIVASNLISSSAVSVNGNQNTPVGQQQGGAESGSQWPTVSKAIQVAGGITEQANIRQIQIRRPQASGQEATLTIDLWKFLSAGDLSQDIQVRDGDTLVIPKAAQVDTAEALQIANSNFSPDAIKVNVVGEVTTPGAVAVKPNTTLNQAILAAGGFKSGRAKQKAVELIRLNPDGTVERRTIAVDFSQNLDGKNNPPLRNNDVVVVNRNGLASVGDTLGTVLGPLGGILGLFSIFR